jgi:4-hydroxybenzoate polyprenyltransferase
MSASVPAGAASARAQFSWGRLRSYVKLEHTLFSVPILLAASVLAVKGRPPLIATLVLLVAAAGARTAGMSLNRIVDRFIDARNPRTAVRELPSGKLSMSHAIWITMLAIGVYLAGAIYFGPLCVLLSPIPLVVFWGYPYLKRFTPLAHFGVGLSLALAPLGAAAALTGTVSGAFRAGGILSLFTFLWVAGFDIIYGTLDVEFDRKSGIHSLPADVGIPAALRISGLLHALAFLCLAALALSRGIHTGALIVLGVCGTLLFLEHRNAQDVDLAFFKFNAWLSFAVLGLVLALQFLPF